MAAIDGWHRANGTKSRKRDLPSREFLEEMMERYPDE
jgi:hypothetical protein